jgi:hypothetical protein
MRLKKKKRVSLKKKRKKSHKEILNTSAAANKNIMQRTAT